MAEPDLRQAGARPLRLLVPALAVGVSVGCALQGDNVSAWREQLQPSSPCYEVNLLDGLDTASTAELQALFACLNRQGQLAPLEPAAAALDAPAAGATVGTQLTGAIAALSDVDVDLLSLVSLLGDALSDADEPVRLMMNVALELSTARPAADVRAGLVDPKSPTTLEAAPLVQMAPLIAPLASALRSDGGAATRHLLADVLAEPELRRWLDTAGVYVGTPDPGLSALLSRLPDDVGAAALAMEDTSNDRWTGATGNSLRDLVEVAVLADAPVLAEVQDDVAVILADAHLRDTLPGTLLTLDDQGHLDGILAGIAWMSSIDATGRPLARGETSALASFLRLLHDANRPVVCRASVLGIGINVNLGNLSVEILGVLADKDADFVVGASSLLSGALSAPLGDAAVNALVDSGLCPAITQRMVNDLDALSVLDRPQAEDLLEALVIFLDILQDGETNHLARVADIASRLVDRGMIEPLEEVVRDLGPTPLAADLVSLLAPLTSPDRFGLRGRDLIRLTDVLDLAQWAVSPRTDGGDGAGWTLLVPVIRPVWQRPALWSTVRSAAGVAVNEATQTHALMDVLPALLRIDPEYKTLALASALLGQDDAAGHLLDAVAEGGLVNSLLASRPQGEDARVPVAWMVELIVDGTVDDLLHFVGLVIDGLNDLEIGADAPPEEPP